MLGNYDKLLRMMIEDKLNGSICCFILELHCLFDFCLVYSVNILYPWMKGGVHNLLIDFCWNLAINEISFTSKAVFSF